MTENEYPAELQLTGLQLHAVFGFLAVSQDRLVVDKCTSTLDGLLEVKCIPSITGQVEDQTGVKQLCLVKRNNGKCICPTHNHTTIKHKISWQQTWMAFFFGQMQQDACPPQPKMTKSVPPIETKHVTIS